jgi:CheY-like chemotaxis protein
MEKLAVSHLSEPPSVLLAEDDSHDVFFMQRAYAHSALPNRLFVVRDGVEAVAYLSGTDPYADRQQFPLPGLLLLDLKMPRMNGFDVLQWLQGRPEFKRLPIVILSGSGLSEDVHRAEELGADDYRVKSSNINHLTQMVYELQARWLNGHRKS